MFSVFLKSTLTLEEYCVIIKMLNTLLYQMVDIKKDNFKIFYNKRCNINLCNAVIECIIYAI